MHIKNVVKKTGFTLLELLIVVLIIGVLTSMAVPMYKKSVERSKVTDALSVMSSVAKSEHDFFLAKNSYTKNFDNLDIVFTDKDGEKAEGATFETNLYTFELLDTGIFATRKTGEYSLYHDYETSQLMCTPSEHYVCEGLGSNFPEAACKKVGMAWANSNSTCYATEEARCRDVHGNSMWHGDQSNPSNSYCGYSLSQNKTIYDGSVCKGGGQNYACNNSTVNSGGVCLATNYFHNCSSSTINNGGICKVTSGGGGCDFITVNEGGQCQGNSYTGCADSLINGGECIANGQAGCIRSTITAGGICRGGGVGGCTDVTLYDGGKCTSSCKNAIVNNGGICSGTCTGAIVSDGGICSGVCSETNINDGAICSGGCWGARINTGGICKSSATNYCGSNHIVYNGGCCCGDYCGTKTKCAQARCDALN